MLLRHPCRCAPLLGRRPTPMGCRPTPHNVQGTGPAAGVFSTRLTRRETSVVRPAPAPTTCKTKLDGSSLSLAQPCTTPKLHVRLYPEFTNSKRFAACGWNSSAPD